MLTHKQIEEVLEAIWTSSERGEKSFEGIKKRCHIPIDSDMLTELEKQDLIAYDGETILLTLKGKNEATHVMRSHRLAERLLADFLRMATHEIETNACEFEHSLAPGVIESICTLLGHPKECPHGNPIPEGKCCLEARHVVENVVVPLTELATGEKARIAYIRTKRHSRLHKLTSLGISPGVSVQIHQKFPSYVLQCEYTELALEEGIAEDVFVVRE